MTMDAIEQEGSEALCFSGDLGDPEHCKTVVEEAMTSGAGSTSWSTTPASSTPTRTSRDITVEQLQRTFQTNIFSMFYMVQAARPHLKKGAAIVNCTCVTMYQGAPGLLDYCATKGAITAFTRSLSREPDQDGIRVNAVAPGPIWTPLNPCGGAPTRRSSSTSARTPRWAAPASRTKSRPASSSSPARIRAICRARSCIPNGGTVVGS